MSDVAGRGRTFGGQKSPAVWVWGRADTTLTHSLIMQVVVEIYVCQDVWGTEVPSSVGLGQSRYHINSQSHHAGSGGDLCLTLQDEAGRLGDRSPQQCGSFFARWHVPLHIPVLRPASWAAPMHSLRGGTSLV